MRIESHSDQRFTRRSALKTGGATIAAVWWPSEAYAHTRRRVARRMSARVPAHLLRSSYHSLVGQHLNVAGTRTRLQLVAVENLDAASAGSQDAFALILRGPRGAPPLANQVPTLSHRHLGKFQLLISPGQASPLGQPYAAIINRLHG